MERHQRYYLGIEIGGTKLQMVTGTANGHIHERRRFTVDPAQGGPGIRRQIEQFLPTLLRQSPVPPAAVAVGFGGPVDRQAGCIACSHQVAGWSDFPLRHWLQDLSQQPVIIENDANTAALGEAACGAGQGHDPLFYVTLGSGVGGGLVVNRRIYHGAKPGEAEIGHVRLDRQGATVESRCSGWAVDARIRALQQAGGTGLLAQQAASVTGGEARFLAAACAAGDPDARRILHETAADLAFALSHVVHLFHPQMIVLGGGLALVGEPLRAAVALALPPLVMDVFQPTPPVRLAALGEDAVPVGCLVAAGQAATDK